MYPWPYFSLAVLEPALEEHVDYIDRYQEDGQTCQEPDGIPEQQYNNHGHRQQHQIPDILANCHEL